jgi:hypothetical protein
VETGGVSFDQSGGGAALQDNPNSWYKMGPKIFLWSKQALASITRGFLRS